MVPLSIQGKAISSTICTVLLVLKFLSISICKSDLTLHATTAEPLLQALQNTKLDLKHIYQVRDLQLRRDAVSFNFDRGRMVFLEPTQGVVTGLLFWGRGTLLAVPPDKIEKQQLNLFTGSPVLNEVFQEVFIRFTDETWQELLSQIEPEAEAQPLESSEALEKFQHLVHRTPALNYRIMADILEGRTLPLFSARIVSMRSHLLEFVFDRRKAEDVYLGQVHASADRQSYDAWCSFASQEHRALQDRSVGAPIDIKHFHIDSQIDKSDRLTAVAEIDFRCERDREWLLTFDLSRSLKVARVEDGAGRPLRFFQNNETSNDREISKSGADVVMVVLAEPTRKGQSGQIRIQYSGDVISRVGQGVFFVGSRGSWYPNVGTTDRATYMLSFRHPKNFTLVATGNRMTESEDGTDCLSVWSSDTEIPVAGFNYGAYEKTLGMAVPTSGVQVEVYANKGIEDVYQEAAARMEYLREVNRRRIMSPGQHQHEPELDIFPSTPNFLDFDTTQFAADIAREIEETLLFYEKILGKFPYRKLAVSQIPGRFSQGWPTLLYASSLSFLSPLQRIRIGLIRDQEGDLLECLHAHEVAHQWWGNLVGWKSYHDLWMFEGFSNYLGYLWMREKYPGGRQFEGLLRSAQERLLAKGAEGQRVETAGAIWLGPRLSSSKFPNAYATIVYDKGAWILHMLRCLFADPETDSDATFRLFLKEFIDENRGQLASTRDFQKIVEKHLPKRLDLEGNHKMDWFFDQWVYDTGIPTYRLDYSVTNLKNGGVRIKGKIHQGNVSEYFLMPVDVFAHFTGDKIHQVGRIVASGNETAFTLTLKSKPQRLTLDENHHILCENKTI